MSADEVPKFQWADYLVLGIFLGFNTLLGLVIGYIDRRKATSKNFLLGGGDMHYIPVALSMQASFLSAIFILSTPTEIYNFGTMYTYMAVSYWIGIPIAAYMFLPTFHKLRLTSAYEYLEKRFNRPVRLAGAVTFSFMVILYMAVVLYSPAIALAQVTGLSVTMSISLCGVVCVIYTVIGGMKATIWNDFIQMIVITVGLIILIILGSVEVVGNFWNIAEEGGRIQFNDFNPDPTVRTTFWTQTIGGTFMNLTLYASSQTIIQKFLSIKKLKNAQKSMWVAALTSTIFLVLVSLLGLVMYGFYATCDPVLSGKIEKADQMVPLFIMEILGGLPGLPGLLIAATFSAALSSISGSLNALSAVFLVDFIRPAYMRVTKENLSERAMNIITRCVALGFGIFTIFMGFAAQFFGDLILQMALSIFGFVGGPLNGLLVLGLFLPFINSWGAMAGLLSSLGICSWIAIGAIVAENPLTLLPRSTDGCPSDDLNYTTTTAHSADYYTLANHTWTTSKPPDDSILWVYKLSHMYYSVIALIVAIVVGIIVTLLTGRAKNTDAKLTFQWGNKCCCYCPQSVRDCLGCGAVEQDDTDSSEEYEEKEVVIETVVMNAADSGSIPSGSNVEDKSFPASDVTLSDHSDDDKCVEKEPEVSSVSSANEKVECAEKTDGPYIIPTPDYDDDIL